MTPKLSLLKSKIEFLDTLGEVHSDDQVSRINILRCSTLVQVTDFLEAATSTYKLRLSLENTKLRILY